MWWVGGGLLDYIVSYLGQVIVIVIGRPRSLTIDSQMKLDLMYNKVCIWIQKSTRKYHKEPKVPKSANSYQKSTNIYQTRSGVQQCQAQGLLLCP